MIRETFKTNSGIMFNSAGLRRIGLDPTGLYKNVRDRPPPVVLGGDETWKEREPVELTWRSRLSSWWHGGGGISLSAAEEGRLVFSRVYGADGTVNVDVHGADGRVLKSSEEEEDLKDALAPIYDKLRWAWWILEILPMRFRVQKEDREWRWRWGWVFFSLCYALFIDCDGL
jgi:hypothetical protein